MLKEYMLSLNYTDNDINKIINTYPLCNMKESTLLNKIKENYSFLKDFGHSDKDIIKMTKRTPGIYKFNKSNLEQKLDNLLNLGYSKKDIIRITKNYSPILELSIDTVKNKITTLISLGYTKEEVINITKELPSIFNMTIDTINNKIEYLMSLGYTKEEVFTITKNLPTIYSYSKENIKDKKNFYDEIGISDFILSKTKNFMQSVELSYARYMFYKSIGIDINIDNYKLLFVEDKIFIRNYGLTKNDILKKYNYHNRGTKHVRTL